MKKKVDPYLWTKDRIKFLYENAKNFDDGGSYTKSLGIWSLKKLIALDYYIKPFIKILKENNFKKCYYVDPFSGTGLIKINNHIFPGSPLIPLLRMKEGIVFDKYFFSDKNKNSIDILGERVRKGDKISDIVTEKNNFKDTIEKLFTGEKPESWKDKGYLVFLDPYGFTVDWKSMERILKSGAVDLMFTCVTWAINWNRNNKNSKKSLTEYFGDDSWKDINNSDEFVNRYRQKIEQLGYLNKYKTYTIDIETLRGQRFDLILASQSPGAGHVLKYIKEKVKNVNTKCIDDAFAVVTGKSKDLYSFIDK